MSYLGLLFPASLWTSCYYKFLETILKFAFLFWLSQVESQVQYQLLQQWSPLSLHHWVSSCRFCFSFNVSFMLSSRQHELLCWRDGMRTMWEVPLPTINNLWWCAVSTYARRRLRNVRILDSYIHVLTSIVLRAYGRAEIRTGTWRHMLWGWTGRKILLTLDPPAPYSTTGNYVLIPTIPQLEELITSWTRERSAYWAKC
jgi:hypothetical protein